jgi:prepilin-type N-terminal cleavage/methylation domain-containing protein
MFTSFPLRRHARGFTLIEIAVVLVIIAVFMAMGTVMFRGFAAAQKRSITSTRLATVDAALVQFVILNKRLPCPANGTLASGGANAGVEVWAAGVCTGNQANGVVPWATLGLTETDATDGWERRITYRTDSDLVVANSMDMSTCDPAAPLAGALVGGFCNSACTNATITTACTLPTVYLVGKGLEIRNVAGTAVMTVMTVAATPTTAAAYVLISHGESGGGGYLNTGTLAATTTTDGTEEQLNYANLALRTYYVDDSISDVAGATHFDDMLSRPSILALASKAGLAPRSH